jgi:hypothetical protein
LDEFRYVNAFAFMALLGKALTFCLLVLEGAFGSHGVDYDLLVGLLFLVEFAATV